MSVCVSVITIYLFPKSSAIESLSWHLEFAISFVWALQLHLWISIEHLTCRPTVSYHIIVYSLIIPHMKIGSTKSYHTIYIKTRNLLLKYCFGLQKGPIDGILLILHFWHEKTPVNVLTLQNVPPPYARCYLTYVVFAWMIFALNVPIKHLLTDKMTLKYT